MRILVTRPEEDAQPLEDSLATRGHTVLTAPMLTIRPVPPPDDLDRTLATAQAVLVTSLNGMRCLADFTTRRDLTIAAVGESTARLARAAGFTKVVAAGGTAPRLAALVTTRFIPQAGPLVHVGGRQVAGDIAGVVERAGFTYRRVILYQAEAARALAPEVARALANDAVDAVLFFSPRTARVFAELVTEAGLEGHLAHAIAFCLSAAVAEAASTLPWRTTPVTAETSRDAMLALVDTYA